MGEGWLISSSCGVISSALHSRCGWLYDLLRRSRPQGRALRALSSVGRAPRLHRGCHRFEPGRAHPIKRWSECDSIPQILGAFTSSAPPCWCGVGEQSDWSRPTQNFGSIPVVNALPGAQPSTTPQRPFRVFWRQRGYSTHAHAVLETFDAWPNAGDAPTLSSHYAMTT